MQKDQASGDLGALFTGGDQPGGVLENPDRVREEFDQDILVSGRHMGTLECMGEAHYSARDDGVKYFKREFERLSWTHTGALLRLQGASLQQLMGPSFVLLSFRERPRWSPRPGLDDVLVAIIDQNPEGLTPQELLLSIVDDALQRR